MDKLLYKYSNANDLNKKVNFLKEQKILRNTVAKMKRESELHEDKSPSIFF